MVYEDVIKAFKNIGDMYYLVRLYDNTYKVRIFFLDKVDEKAVLAVDTIDGQPAKLEPYVENMPLRLASKYFFSNGLKSKTLNSTQIPRIFALLCLHTLENFKFPTANVCFTLHYYRNCSQGAQRAT